MRFMQLCCEADFYQESMVVKIKLLASLKITYIWLVQLT